MAVTLATVHNAFSLFVKPVSDTLQISRSAFSMCLAVTSLTAMVMAPLWGFLYSRYALRRLFCLSLAGLAAMIAMYGFAQTTTHLYLTAVGVGLFYGGSASLPVSIVVTHWFERQRALALSIAFAGTGLGGMLLNPLVNVFILNIGWRNAFFSLGSIILLIAVPIAFLLIRKTPAELGLRAYGAGELAALLDDLAQRSGLTLAEVLRKPWFWLFVMAAASTSIVTNGTLINIPAYLSDVGYQPGFVALITALYSGLLIVGKMTLGAIYDRFGMWAGTAYVGTMMALTCLSLLFVDSVVMLYLMALLFGLGACISTITTSYLSVRLFGTKNYSQIYGIVQLFHSLGVAAGIPAVSRMYDLLGSYHQAWIILFALSVLMTLAFLGCIRAAKAG